MNAVLGISFPIQSSGAPFQQKNTLFPIQGPGGTILTKNVYCQHLGPGPGVSTLNSMGQGQCLSLVALFIKPLYHCALFITVIENI